MKVETVLNRWRDNTCPHCGKRGYPSPNNRRVCMEHREYGDYNYLEKIYTIVKGDR